MNKMQRLWASRYFRRWVLWVCGFVVLMVANAFHPVTSFRDDIYVFLVGLAAIMMAAAIGPRRD